MTKYISTERIGKLSFLQEEFSFGGSSDRDFIEYFVNFSYFSMVEKIEYQS
jgi:hypothetical protein